MILFVVVVVFSIKVGLCLVAPMYQLISLSDIELEYLVVVWAVKDLRKKALLQIYHPVVAGQNFKITLCARDQRKLSFSFGVIERYLGSCFHAVEHILQIGSRLFIGLAKGSGFSVLFDHLGFTRRDHADLNRQVGAFFKFMEG